MARNQILAPLTRTTFEIYSISVYIHARSLRRGAPPAFRPKTSRVVRPLERHEL